MSVKDTPKKSGIQSLSRAVDILETVAGNRDGIGLADICKQVGLHTSTAHHLAQTLVLEGMLRQDVTTKTYRIGSRLFGLASSSMDEIEIHETARPILLRLAASTAENTHVAVWSGHHVVIIGKCEGSSSVRVAERAGVLRPAYATAIGKCLLSGLSKDAFSQYLAATDLETITDKTIATQEALIQERTRVKMKGFAEDNGEMDPDIHCIAAPARDFSGQAVVSIGISAPRWRINDENYAKICAEIIEAAQEFSTALGYRG